MIFCESKFRLFMRCVRFWVALAVTETIGSGPAKAEAGIFCV